ncbi:MAG: NAD(P)-dependent alcohol dehydrogenase [Ardenticatenaceae bacterium]|nr:NAD(P)-dependent alcohol dehydrogenase [Ardenticatenaceae bacterium]MCB9445955.1 NAD(P)-dependent alcohol dehydrogenase [Ardenticatenaceae bacterium]
MKAIVHTKYGSPDFLKLKEMEKPVPGDGDVFVKIQAASINYGDKALVKGEPFLVRLMGYGLLKPKHAIPGGDIAGRVEAVGSSVTQFQPGDTVFGDIGECGFGAYAEYVAVPEDALVLKPDNLTFEEAAAVPQAAVVALQGLRDKGQIQPGQKVLINGASGGVGTFAVQIAKALGAEVTAVCSTKNLDLVRSIGADHVIDYNQEDFTKSEQRYDIIFDIVANHSVSDYMRVLTPQGNYVACAFNATSLFLGPFLSKKDGKKASSLVHKPNRKDLVFMKELLEAGQVVPVIGKRFPLGEVADGMRWLENGRHRGKVVITM